MGMQLAEALASKTAQNIAPDSVTPIADTNVSPLDPREMSRARSDQKPDAKTDALTDRATSRVLAEIEQRAISSVEEKIRDVSKTDAAKITAETLTTITGKEGVSGAQVAAQSMIKAVEALEKDPTLSPDQKADLRPKVLLAAWLRASGKSGTEQTSEETSLQLFPNPKDSEGKLHGKAEAA